MVPFPAFVVSNETVNGVSCRHFEVELRDPTLAVVARGRQILLGLPTNNQVLQERGEGASAISTAYATKALRLPAYATTE